MRYINDIEATGLPLCLLIYFDPPHREIKRAGRGR
jgi:hypothetical protein